MLVGIKYLPLILLLFPLSSSNKAKKPAKSIYFISTNVTYNQEYIEHYHIALTSNKTLNLAINICQDYPYDPWVTVDLGTMDRKTKNYRTAMQYDFNGCNMLSKQGDNIILTWIHNVLKYGNLPKQCPILKGHYSWNDIKVDKLSIPIFLPVALYKLEVDTYFRLKPKIIDVANVTLFFELK